MLRRISCLALFALAFPVTAARAADDDAVPTVAHIKLHGELDEAPAAADPFFGTSAENFKAKIDRIKKAKKDDTVKALYLQLDGLHVGYGKIDELSRAIADFRKSGKKAFAYVESGETGDYMLALACDEVCMPEGGWLMLVGMRLEVTFFKDLFDKIGVKADMLQMGDFKGAAEPFTRNSLSEPNKKQLRSLLDDRFDKGMVAHVAKARGMTEEQVRKLIDEGPYTARAALKARLIDRIEYADPFQKSFKDALKVAKVDVVKNYGQAKSAEISFDNPLAILKMLSPPKTRKSKEPKVAVVYATGVIVTGKSSFSFLGGESCGSTTMIEAIREADSDDTVKAIVLRVDSPGGSALASDLIWNELKRCKKPVVASMSDVAASGGYYVSMAAKKIYAEPGTITGSIGVVGGKLTLGGLFDKIGITTETLSRGANANIFSATHTFSDSERKAFTAMMHDIYDQFLDKALEGRKKAGKEMTRAKFESLAGGRVWTGRQALANDLIDELGTLDDAVAAAWKMAGQPADKEPEILQLPKGKSPLDALLDLKGDTRMMAPEQLALIRAVPELARKLATVEAMLNLRGEPVWLINPFCIEMK
jgi:protease-4